jgi:HEAT repeat protein
MAWVVRIRIIVTLGALVICATAPAAQSRPGADTTALAALLSALRDENPNAREEAVAAMQLHASTYLPTLEQWMSDRSMRRASAASAAIVLIGPQAYPTIRRALLDPDRRFSMEYAFGVIDSSRIVLATVEPWLTDPNPALRAAAVGVLNVYRDDAAHFTSAILRALRDSHPEVRSAALALHVTQIREDSAQQQLADGLAPFLASSIASERRAAVYSLGNSHPHGRDALPQILRLAEHDPDVEIRWLSARVLTWQGAAPRDAQPVLLRMLEDAADTVRVEAMLAIGAIGVEGLSPALSGSVVRAVESRLASRNQSMREAAATALAYIGAPTVDAMIAALRSPHTAVAVTSAEGLSALPQLRAIDEPLLSALSDRRAAVREAAGLALVGVGSRVEARLRALSTRRPERRRATATMVLGLIADQAMIDVADRCYQITYGAWEPAIPFRTIEGILPPTAVRFRPIVASRPTAESPATFVIEQRSGGDWHRTGWWRPDTTQRRILLNASPQLSGVAIEARPDQRGMLVGVARTYWDFRQEREEAPVRLEEYGCSVAP